jgi:tRNA (cytidine56-2'-O)-methyltransferase
MNISILRLGHRIFRDQRLSTHIFLTGRSLGAEKGFYTGQRDAELEASIQKIVRNWGGPFKLEYKEKPAEIIKKFKGSIIHLTVYGIPFKKKIRKIKKEKNIMVIVGGGKVSPEIYQKADYNISVSSQPISEVSALGIFLYELNGFREEFNKARLKVIPQEKGKRTVEL